MVSFLGMEEFVDYDEEPVCYCRRCLSLRIKDVPMMDDSDYCEDCGSTDVGSCSIGEWEAIYERRHGVRYLDN